jgi:hypothetical protein
MTIRFRRFERAIGSSGDLGRNNVLNFRMTRRAGFDLSEAKRFASVHAVQRYVRCWMDRK